MPASPGTLQAFRMRQRVRALAVSPAQRVRWAVLTAARANLRRTPAGRVRLRDYRYALLRAPQLSARTAVGTFH
jgi:hypothetical protein